MKILYIAHRIPYPPDKGDKIRAYHQIRHLARGHEIHLRTLVDDPDDWRWVPELERLCASVTARPLNGWRARARAGIALLKGRAFSPAFFRDPSLRAAIRNDLDHGDFDAAIVFCSAMMDTLPEGSQVPVLADYCDLDSAKWAAYADELGAPRSWLWRAEANRLADFEVARANRARWVVFATPLEAEDFNQLPGTGGSPVEVIPNGVDLEAFDRGEADRAEVPTVVFTGAMDYRPNYEGALWFIDRVWSSVRQRVPDARLHVVGRNPPERLARHDDREGVRVTGTVPEIQPWLHEAWLAVAPLQIARGVQNKVLEAMAADVPTLISPSVARGLGAQSGSQTLVEDGIEAWIDRTVQLLRDADLRRGIAAGGLHYVRSHHDWNAHGAAWERLLNSIDRSLREAA